MFLDLDPLWWFFLLGVIGWTLAGPKPRNRAAENWKQAQRQQARAARAASRAARQVWRRRVFGSHPVLYGALFWLSPVLLMALVAWLH